MKLTDATTGTAALEVLSRRWYYTHHDGKPCPPDALLTPERLGAWAPNTPAPAVRKARAALCALLGDGSEWVAEQGELLGCGPIRRELVPAPDGRLPTCSPLCMG